MKNSDGSGRTGIALGVAALATWIAISPMAAYGQVKPNVTVVNPASNPVNTRITNVVVPVEVSNADAIPVVALDAEGSREAFAKVFTIDMDSSNIMCNQADLLAVPAGKRAVIRYVSVYTVLGPSVELVAVRLHSTESFANQVIVPGSKSWGNPSVTYIAAAQAMHVYSDDPLYACVVLTGSEDREITAHVLGYYVDKN